MIFEQLNLKGHDAFGKGFNALRSLQLEKGGGITAGNLLLLVPGRVAAYAEEVVRLGQLEKLPVTAELNARIDEFSRDEVRDGRHVSIPIDLLYSTTDHDRLHVRLLARAKASPAERAELRRRSLFLRYFVCKAFAGYRSDQLDLKLGFYLDSDGTIAAWHGTDSQFNADEWLNRGDFWTELCPGADPRALFRTIRQSASKALSDGKVVPKLKEHFARKRQQQTSATDAGAKE